MGKGEGVQRLGREILQALLLGAVIFLLTRHVVQTFRVEQRSMEPTLHEGQYLIVYKLAYAELDLPIPILAPTSAHAAETTHVVASLGGPRRGDIVVFVNPTNPGQHLIKRVVGLPGETVAVVNGEVLINGVALDEPYLSVSTGYSLAPQRIPPDHFFVLGDNRNNSFDSHHFGPIARELLVGKAYALPLIWRSPVVPRFTDFLRI